MHHTDHSNAFASWLRCHKPLSYFALAFGISWGGIANILAATGFNLAALQPLETGLIFVAMLLGPSVSGLVLTALPEGRPGSANSVRAFFAGG